jgi:hypothetical protein
MDKYSKILMDYLGLSFQEAHQVQAHVVAADADYDPTIITVPQFKKLMLAAADELGLNRVVNTKNVKFYQDRYDAEEVLRRLGISERDYSFFIDEMPSGMFACQIAKAEAHLDGLGEDEKPDEIKTYGSRTSATNVLRKLKVDPSLYDNFMTKRDDGKYDLNLTAARLGTAPVIVKTVVTAEAKGETVTREKPKGGKTSTVKKSSSEKPKPKELKENCTAMACRLILEGKTNAEVWDQLKKSFNLDDKKRGYPAWYRRKLRLDGKIS